MAKATKPQKPAPRATRARGKKVSTKAKSTRAAATLDALPETEPAPLLEASSDAMDAMDVPADVIDSAPEVNFAARVPPPEPERPLPRVRRAVFFDVENTSRPSDVTRMLDEVGIDRASASTELVAAGNWRVVGSPTARLLASRGAHLVHSAPATGVRDWSDLRIAVSAGIWLASARAGDVLDIVSDDRAFDVVGDVSATLGVRFKRWSYRAAGRAARAPEAAATEGAPARTSASGGRGRRGGRGRSAPARAPRSMSPAATAPLSAAEPGVEPLVSDEAQAPSIAGPPKQGGVVSASQDEVLATLRDLLARSPSGVSLDTVANRLKARGFERPPGSPRLITRLRGIRELDVSARGLIRLKGAAAQPTGQVEAATEPGAGSSEPPVAGATGSTGRRRRRGGRSRRGAGGGRPPTTVPSSDA